MVINIGLSQNHLTHLSEVSASIFKPSKEIIYRFLRPCTIVPILNMGNIFPSNIANFLLNDLPAVLPHLMASQLSTLGNISLSGCAMN